MINEKEIQNLGYDFWKIVKSGVNGSMAEHLFVNPGVLAPNGSWLKLEAHQELHRSLCDEVHEWVGDLSIKVLSENPERVQVNGIVHWEATIKENGNRIVSEVGEQFHLPERVQDFLREL